MANPDGKAQISLFAATFAVVLLQHAINVLNDVADWQLGADTEKWDSWVRYHRENLTVANLHGWLSSLAGGLLGLLTLAWNDRLWILAIATPLVILGYRYNSGEKPLSYTRLAEWVTGLCYGPGVFACLWLVVGQTLDLTALLGSTAFGCLAVALLLSHQPPQIHTDRLAGKQSFAAIYGAEQTIQTVRILFFVFLVLWGGSLARLHPTTTFLALNFALSGLAFAVACSQPPGPKHLLLSSSLLFGVLLLVRLFG